MAAWLPVVKAAIPHIAQVVSVAMPIFTARAASADREALTARQISELQDAATQNAESVKEIATQLKTALEGLEAGAADVQHQLRRQRQLSIITIALASIAIVLSFLALSG